MPFLLLLLAIPLLVLLPLLLMPIGLWQRYRMGSKRQRARGWVTTLNIAGFSLSAILLIVTAAVMAIFEPRVLLMTAVGFAIGAVLAPLGLLLTRWEPGDKALYFTPNRWLVLGLLVLVTARIFYAFWRGFALIGATSEDSFLHAVGIDGSMGAAALFLGYTVAYWAGVRFKMKRYRPARIPR